MKKWCFLLCGILIFNGKWICHLKDVVSLDELRNAGMPVKMLEKAGMKKGEMEQYLEFWKDLKYFPVAFQKKEEEQRFYFEDTWKAVRNYHGEHLHEGCDVFGEEDRKEYYPVVSITDGIVEQVGWLPLGGWRIGIRSFGGGYFYYAHLSSYSREFQVGESVRAGEILGLMGDTGYGKKGTCGKFPCHLHLGIYIKTEEAEEYPLNPYPVLYFLKNRQKIFSY